MTISYNNVLSTTNDMFLDEPVDLSQVQWDDIHLITGALKMFLRELPEPVIPFAFFRQFITACSEFFNINVI